MVFTFLLVIQAIVASALIGVILMQKSEGGGLGVGGSPAGFLSARGASDFLSRATAVLASIFVGLSIALAVLASVNHGASRINVNAVTAPAAAPVVAGEPVAPAPGSATGSAVPLAGGGAPAALNPDDPLAAAAAGAVGAPADKGIPLQQ